MTITNAAVASELLNVLINNMRSYYSIFVRLQRKTNNYYTTHLILFWLIWASGEQSLQKWEIPCLGRRGRDEPPCKKVNFLVLMLKLDVV